ncbi:MAG: RagB/SusD family nutrient uptake outer membrane protein, partial [Bacteroidales bacterium]|nr:RagB/SusD family nutrient uptake outer membrane protein [Bacteroidales bacterium]
LSNKELVLIKDRTGTGMIWRQNIFLYGNSNESILEFQYGNSNQGIVNNALFSYFGSSSRNPHFNIPLDITSWDLNSIFGKKDFRAKVSYTKAAGAASGESTKFQDSESSGANMIIYRLPEIYLMKAEALVQLDFELNKNQALNLINTVYMRAQATPTVDDSLLIATYNEKMLMDDLILTERQRELMFEGKRWFDIMRAARRENTMRVFSKYILPNVEGSYYELATAKLTKEWARYFPVPLAEIESNPLLKQNPFYETLLDK